MITRILNLTLGILAALLICGISARADQPLATEAGEQILRRGYSTSFASVWNDQFDPVGPNTYLMNHAIRDIFASPVRQLPNGEPAPGAAESWELSADGLTYTFHLPPDSRWSDGEPLTADDFVFAFDRFKPREALGYETTVPTQEIASYRAVDNHTLEVTLKRPNGMSILDFSSGYFSPMPRHVAPADIATPWMDWPGYVSNGVYKLDEITADLLRMSRNPHGPAWANPDFGIVEHHRMTWPELTNATLAGEMDLVYRISGKNLEFFQDKANVLPSIRERVYFYVLNPNVPALQDIRVRKALYLAVDRQTICDRIRQGNCAPAFTIVADGGMTYKGPDIAVPFDQGLEEAKALMREAGYGPDNPLRIQLSSNENERNLKITSFIGVTWKEIYVEATIDVLEEDFSAWLKRFSAGDYEIARRGVIPDYYAADNYLALCFDGDAKCGYFDNDEYEDLILTARGTGDVDARNALYRQAEELLIETYLLIPVFFHSEFFVSGDRIDVSSETDWSAALQSYDIRRAKPQ